MGLKWKDIDDQFTSISINTGYQKLKGKVIVREPKTGKSRRLIPLTAAASEVLKNHYQYSETALDSMDIDIEGNVFFCHLDTGELFHPSSVSHA